LSDRIRRRTMHARRLGLVIEPVSKPPLACKGRLKPVWRRCPASTIYHIACFGRLASHVHPSLSATNQVLKLVLVACLMGAKAARAATPLGTGFTYQGQLRQNGSPVTGTRNLRFSLWDAQSTSPGVGGDQLGASQTLDNVSVSGGLFTVTLN